MRIRLSIVILVLAATVALPAETIRLKNGRIILADSVREKDGRVEYDIGENSYAIPKSSVERIEAGGSPVAAAHEEIPAVPLPPIRTADELAARLVHDGRLDLDALSAVEQEGDAEKSAAAYFVAARHEEGRGDFEQARAYLRRAMDLLPTQVVLLEHYAALLLRMGRYAEAVSYGERATRADSNSADAFAVLGLAYFQSDRPRDAVRAFRRSRELRPTPLVEQYLAKAEKELEVEAGFQEQGSQHFNLRFEGTQSPQGLRQQILATLERHYTDLISELDIVPHDSISVLLYTNQAFFDVTQAPSWSAALNDGRLRIPVEGLESVTPQLARVLKHELAHSFINQGTRGRCPLWLHEGVAQAVEPKSSAAQGRRLAHLFAAQQQIPLNQLEASFQRLSALEAVVAYAESLAAIEYIRDTYGMSDVIRILKRIGEGQSTEAALRSTVHSGYAELEQEVGAYLRKAYGE